MARTPERARKTRFQLDQNELKIQAAWLYYVEGLTQEKVAEQLGISRIKAFRLLAATREDGTVTISINAQAASAVKLQRALEKHLGLFEAVVVSPSDQSERSIAAVVGHATGRYLSDQLSDGMSIGVGWGSTLEVCMRSLTWRELNDMTVVSLLGGLTHASAHNPSAVAWRLADFYQTELYQITAPVFVADSRFARELWKEPDLQELRRQAGEVDIALFSVGDVSRHASIFRRNILSWEDGETLRDAGAAGDALCHFVDADGNIVDHPVNERVMAINPRELRKVPKVIISSGGQRKAPAIRAGIAATNAKVLITDIAAANALLDLPPIEAL